MQIKATPKFKSKLVTMFYVADYAYVIGYIADQIRKGLAEEMKPGVFLVWIYGIPAYVCKAGNALVSLRYVG